MEPESFGCQGLPSAFGFSIAVIKIFIAARAGSGCLMEPDHKGNRSLAMKSQYPFDPTPGKSEEVSAPPPSRLTDEKISDESGTESKADSALAPAGLNNPFWN
jgi:hypothetical protein